MKIAIPYEHDEVFQHFGKAQTFKVYEVNDEQITGSELVPAAGEGHDAQADLLAGMGVAAVVCGGIGDGAMKALEGAGIMVFAGFTGKADDAVQALLEGNMAPSGESTCGCEDEGSGCGGCGGSEGGCGGCGGGCGGCGGKREPLFEGTNVGKTCSVHYRGTLDDGTQFDCSYDRGEPLSFVCGMGMMIPGFDRAVAEMEVGQKLTVRLAPEEAYGPVNPEAILKAPIAQLRGSEELEVGQQVYLTNMYGQPIPVRVVAKDETTITLDANHEMAGKALNFEIELVELSE